MSKWTEITSTEHADLYLEISYRPFASGRMLTGGRYTEYTPRSLLNANYPDLRTEISDFGAVRHFKKEI